MWKIIILLYFFVEELKLSPFKSWIVSTSIIFPLVYTGDFWIEMFASMFIGIFFMFVLLPVLLVVNFAISITIDLWADESKKAYFLEKEKNYFKKLQKENEILEKKLNNSKTQTDQQKNSNFLLGLLAGIGFGWMLFGE